MDRRVLSLIVVQHIRNHSRVRMYPYPPVLMIYHLPPFRCFGLLVLTFGVVKQQRVFLSGVSHG